MNEKHADELTGFHVGRPFQSKCRRRRRRRNHRPLQPIAVSSAISRSNESRVGSVRGTTADVDEREVGSWQGTMMVGRKESVSRPRLPIRDDASAVACGGH